MSTFFNSAARYFARVVTHESTKRGIAAAGAGVIMSMIIEAAWPSTRAA
jgi:hypothetical protein